MVAPPIYKLEACRLSVIFWMSVVSSMLDKLLINQQWDLWFQDAVVLHHLAPVLKSDHRPLLLQFNQGEQQNRHCRPFKFLVAWITHENFGEFFRNKWAPSKNLAPMSIEEFQLALKNCNNNVFGNIHRKKKGLLCTLSHDKSPCIKTFGMNMKMSSSRRNYCGSKSQGVSGLSLI